MDEVKELTESLLKEIRDYTKEEIESFKQEWIFRAGGNIDVPYEVERYINRLCGLAIIPQSKSF